MKIITTIYGPPWNCEEEESQVELKSTTSAEELVIFYLLSVELVSVQTKNQHPFCPTVQIPSPRLFQLFFHE